MASAGAQSGAGAVTSLRESALARLVITAGNLSFPRDPEKSALGPGDGGGEGRRGKAASAPLTGRGARCAEVGVLGPACAAPCKYCC